jgi:hypothetical protein
VWDTDAAAAVATLLLDPVSRAGVLAAVWALRMWRRESYGAVSTGESDHRITSIPTMATIALAGFARHTSQA